MSTKIHKIEIRKMTLKHTIVFSEMFKGVRPEYSKYFIPFEFSISSIRNILSRAIADQYYGIFANNVLAGFYMLRGFDAGYRIPTYGVWISPKYARNGFAKLTILHAISTCKLNNIEKIMLKVHPENLYAKKLYEDFGFKYDHIDLQNKYLVYYKEVFK